MLAHKLRDHFEFWILPMVNPDGIISGNYRCNTQGKDNSKSGAKTETKATVGTTARAPARAKTTA